MEDSDVVEVGGERESVDLGGRHAVLDLQRALVQDQHGAGRQHKQDRHKLQQHKLWTETQHILKQKTR